MSGFVNPSYTGEARFQRFKLKAPKSHDETTHNVYRFFPPYGSLAARKRHSQYHGVHYGYMGTDPADEGKTKMRPFECIQDINWSTREILVACPQCDLYAQRKAELELRVAELKAEKRSDSEIEALTKDLTEWLRTFNRDSKHYYAVMDEDGNFGVLGLSKTTREKLEEAFKRTKRDSGVDPLALEEGCWIDIERRGLGRNTEDTPVVKTESQVFNGRKVLAIVTAPISDEIAEAALAVLPDLTNLHTRLTADQIARLVACSGDPEEVDAIFNEGREKKEEKAPAPPKAAERPPTVSRPVPKAPVQTAPAAEPATGGGDDEEAALEAQLAAIKAAKAKAAVAPPVKQKEAPKAPPKEPARPLPPAAPEDDEDFNSMDEETFLKRFPTPG